MTRPEVSGFLRLLLSSTAVFFALSAWGDVVFRTGKQPGEQVWFDQVAAVYCHRLDERKLDFDGHKTAACSRCTGIFTGAVAGSALVLSVNALPVLTGVLLLNTADVVSGTLNGPSAANKPRFILGFALGLLFSVTILQRNHPALRLWKRPEIQ
jgi:uncharacterized membrane protein